ncbi:MAG: MarR family transcriptional regulator [Desulfurococcales archaeon]|nr:MarR family transcriptional regulator [Desulfurococcales archaeon]
MGCGVLEAEALAKALNSLVNLEILALLSSRPSYTREIASALGRDEADVSRRLRRLERLGLVEGYWARVGGRNVRVYRLAVGGLRIEFRGGQVRVVLEGGSRELGVDPSIVTSAPRPVELVGREAELEALRSSGAPVAHVWGPPGIGKTALAAAVAAEAGAPVLWYPGGPSETPGVMAWRASAWLRLLGLEGVEPAASSGGPGALADALAGALSRLGALLVVDDYHLLPAETAGVVLRLALSAGDYRVVVLSRRLERRLAARPDKALVIRLEPLGPRESCELTERLSPGATRGVGCDALHAATAGVPAVLVAALRAPGGGLLEAARRAMEAYRSGVSSQLSPGEREALALLSAAGSWLPVGVACEALGLARGRCGRLLESLEARGLVELGRGLARAREYARAGGRPPGEVLARLAGALARHPSSEWRVRGLSVLAKLCAPREAALAVRDRLLRGSSYFLCCPDLYARSVEALWGCASGADPYLDALYAAEYALVATLNLQGRVGEAIKLLEGALPRLYRDRPLYVRVLALLAGFKMWTGSLEEGMRDYERAEALYRRLPRAERALVESTLQATAQLVYMARGEAERALAAAMREAEISLEEGDLANYFISLIHTAEIERMRGRHREALAIVERVRRESAQTGGLHPIVEQTLAVPAVLSLVGLGRYAEARAEAERALELEAATRHRPLLAVAAAVLALHAGDARRAAATARRHLEEACSRAGGLPQPWDECTALKVAAALAEGGCPEAPQEPPEGEPGVHELLGLLAGARARRCGEHPARGVQARARGEIEGGSD